jgi:hypothetical protein
VSAEGIDVDALAASLQRQGAAAFQAGSAALLAAVDTKPTRLASGTGSEGPTAKMVRSHR